MVPQAPHAALAATVRPRFATLRERNYLASPCLGPLLDETLADLDAYRRSLTLRKRVLPEWVERMEETITLVERVLHAPRGAVALRDSATAAQAALLGALELGHARRKLVVGRLDFHSSRYLWHAQARRGFEVVEVGTAGEPALPLDALVGAIDERTLLVALALVSPRTGALLDVAPIVERARRVGALVLLDVYQAVGAVPVDVGALGVDALVGGTHKWLSGGGMGLAFLYVRPELAATLEPAFPGWLGRADWLSFSDGYEPAAGARRFAQGTPALEPMYTARAGLRFVLEVGAGAIRERTRALGARIAAGVAALGVPLSSPRDAAARGPMLCLDLARAAEAVSALEAIGIDVDSRPGAGLRVAPHFCTTEAECDAFVAALARHC